MALVLLAEYKAYYNITTTTADVETQLSIDLADSIITKFCGRSLEAVTYTEKHNGGQPSILLANFPVNNIISITEDGLATTDFTLADPDIGEVVKGTAVQAHFSTRYATFSGQIQGVEITYDAGYAVIPADIKYCVYLLARKLLADKKAKVIAANGVSGSIQAKTQSLHGEDRQYGTSAPNLDLNFLASQASILPAEVMAILREYI